MIQGKASKQSSLSLIVRFPLNENVLAPFGAEGFAVMVDRSQFRRILDDIGVAVTTLFFFLMLLRFFELIEKATEDGWIERESTCHTFGAIILDC